MSKPDPGKAMSGHLPKVAVIGTGGTISAISKSSLDLIDYGGGRHMQADELVASVPELATVARIVAVPFSNVGSGNVGPAEWLALINLVQGTVQSDPEIAGIVVTHGTATLEETAYFLGLAARVAVPVVVVGSMRPASALGAEGGLNLFNAVRVAASSEARGLGALVVMNDEIHAARDVTKTANYRVNTFVTRDFGILGYADGDRVEFYRRPLRQTAPDTPFEVAALKALPRVDIIPAYAGADGALVEAAVAAGARGLVSAGFPAGSPTPVQKEALKAAAGKGVVVVQSSRAGSGRVVDTRLALRSAGFIGADTLTPQKARILLMLALTVSSDVEEIRRMFSRY